MRENKCYVIGDKTFTQNKLKTGQWEQLVEVFESIDLKEILLDIQNNPDYIKIIKALGKNVIKAAAIIIVDKESSLAEKDLNEVENYLRNNSYPEDITEIVKDFFYFNPIHSNFNDLKMKFGEIKDQIIESISKIDFLKDLAVNLKKLPV